MVYVTNDAEHAKQKLSYIGPFEITYVDRENHNVELWCNGHHKVININRIKRAFEVMKPGNRIYNPDEVDLNATLN